MYEFLLEISKLLVKTHVFFIKSFETNESLSKNFGKIQYWQFNELSNFWFVIKII